MNLRNRVYYRLKPLLPFAVRMTVRRWLAARERSKASATWPILPGSETPPEGWPGWPDGKKFAVVLTHDVEGAEGLAKCRALMQVEKELGFRSSFNFIPEGPYRVGKELREELVAEGFEIGVHDLHHDGNLFSDRGEFIRRAQRINGYLKEWGAVGFRAGFMLRNLQWLHHLDIQYDASTFDTDPFEPQPDGAGTIFPFWVPAPVAQRSEVGDQKSGNRHFNPTLSSVEAEREGKVGGQRADSPSNLDSRPSSLQPPTSDLGSRISDFPARRAGYVELPYTLPQDSTLFLLFGEETPGVWVKKLDWIAAHGGMVLLNVHPDYVQTDEQRASAHNYPLSLYARFFEHLRSRYGDSFWQPLPKEMAAWVARTRPRPPRHKKRICMVAYSHYTSDARVTRYAEALARRGDQVDVIALKRSPKSAREEMVGNVRLIRLQVRSEKTERSPLSFLFPILRFLVSSSFWLTREHMRKRYDLLHIHNIPDFLVFAGWYPKSGGAKIILDIHDIVPEFYASKFKTGENSTAIKLLKATERAAARFADHVIISNHLWRDKYAARTSTEDRCSVFINNVDSGVFRPRPRTRNDGKTIVLFPGGLQWHQGLDIAIRAFKRVVAELPNAEFHIYGDGNMKPSLVALADELKMNGSVRFFDPRPVREVAEIMANSDLGVVPKRADSFGNEAFSTKIMEFMSLGVPVVASSTKIDRFYYDDSVLRFFESGNVDALADAMLEVLRNRELRQKLVVRAGEYAARNNWDCRKADYLTLVDSLVDGRTGDVWRPESRPVASPPAPAQ